MELSALFLLPVNTFLSIPFTSFGVYLPHTPSLSLFFSLSLCFSYCLSLSLSHCLSLSAFINQKLPLFSSKINNCYLIMPIVVAVAAAIVCRPTAAPPPPCLPVLLSYCLSVPCAVSKFFINPARRPLWRLHESKSKSINHFSHLARESASSEWGTHTHTHAHAPLVGPWNQCASDFVSKSGLSSLSDRTWLSCQ